MKRVMLLAVALCASAMVNPAQAATVTFNFYCDDKVGGVVSLNTVALGGGVVADCTADIVGLSGETLTYENGGITVVASATSTVAGQNFVHHDIAPPFGGLGVGPNGDELQKNDNIGVGETLRLTFSQDVQILQITAFTDHLQTFTTDSLFHLGGVQVSRASGQSSLFNFSAFLQPQGTTFDFFVTNPDGGEYDGFYISAVVVQTTPEPATILLFGGALIGVAARARRRRS